MKLYGCLTLDFAERKSDEDQNDGDKNGDQFEGFRKHAPKYRTYAAQNRPPHWAAFINQKLRTYARLISFISRSNKTAPIVAFKIDAMIPPPNEKPTIGRT